MHEPASQTRRTIRFNNQNGKNHTIRAVAAEPKGKASRRSAPEHKNQRRQHRTARRSSNQQRDDPPQGGGKGGAASRRVPSLQRSRTPQPGQTVRQRPIEYSSGSEAPERLQRYATRLASSPLRRISRTGARICGRRCHARPQRFALSPTRDSSKHCARVALASQRRVAAARVDAPSQRHSGNERR